MGVKPGFMVYHKAADLLCNLPDEACGILFKSLVLYSRDGVTSDFSEHPFSAFLDAIFSEQKKLIDEDAKKYRKMCEAQTARINSRWHKKALPDATPEYHGIPGNTTEYRCIPQDTNMQYTSLYTFGIETKEDKDKSLSKKTTKPQKCFNPPSVEEVAAYCRERKNAVNPEQFCDYYTANGWKVGRHSMKDWKAAVRTWEHKEAEKGTADNDRWTADNL